MARRTLDLMHFLQPYPIYIFGVVPFLRYEMAIMLFEKGSKGRRGRKSTGIEPHHRSLYEHSPNTDYLGKSEQLLGLLNARARSLHVAGSTYGIPERCPS